MAGALSGDIDIPKVGKLPKAAVVIGVGGVVGLIIWQNHKNGQAAAAPAATGADPYPSDGTTGNPNDPYSLDPSTGVTYGDEAASGAGTGYGGYDVGLGSGGAGYAGGGYGISAVTDSYPWDGTYNNSSDPYSMDSATGQTYGNEGTTGTSAGTVTGTSGPPFSTNAQWSQYVLSYYSAGGADVSALTAALGLYLAGQPVTAAQQGLVNEATAIAGAPPVSGPNGYPPSINVTGSTAGGTGTSATGSTVTGTQVPVISGGHVVSVTTAEAVVAWTQTVSQTATVTITGPGAINGKQSNVTKPQATYGGLESGHNYEVLIQPTVNGKAAGKSGTITFKTK